MHDNHHFRPLLQIDDFVVVQAKAAHAAIQVKRRMDSDQLRKALANVIGAKEHLIWMCQDISRNPLAFFSAVLFFDEKSPGGDGKPSETYKNCILEQFSDPKSWELAPDFIGSLEHHFYRRSVYGIDKLEYTGYPAYADDQNIAVQFLLWVITHIISGYGRQPPMVVASLMKSHSADTIEITTSSSSTCAGISQKGGQS